MRILIVNDDAGESAHLAGAVTRRGCEVVTVSSVGDALAVLHEVDVAMLSVESSGTDVVAVVEAIRAESNLPLVVVATRVDPDTCVEALLAGADDYLARLVPIDELMARIRVLLRRHRRSAEMSWRLIVDDVEIDLERRHLTVAGEHVDLTEKEFKVISIIARQGGRACTKERILAYTWGDTETATDDDVRAHIATLRSKIGRPHLIETVEFVGYRLTMRPTVATKAVITAAGGDGAAR